eukprot:5020246-Lingulodinium_polyedra.AAC.1
MGRRRGQRARLGLGVQLQSSIPRCSRRCRVPRVASPAVAVSAEPSGRPVAPFPAGGPRGGPRPPARSA